MNVDSNSILTIFNIMCNNSSFSPEKIIKQIKANSVTKLHEGEFITQKCKVSYDALLLYKQWSKYVVYCSESLFSVTHPHPQQSKTIVLWLDGNANESKDCIDTEPELSRLIAYLKTFTNLNDGVTYSTQAFQANTAGFS